MKRLNISFDSHLSLIGELNNGFERIKQELSCLKEGVNNSLRQTNLDNGKIG